MANTSGQDSTLGSRPFGMTPENHLDRYRRTTGTLRPGNSILREGLDWRIVQALNSSLS
jgi:hypothetical protein